MTVVDEALRLVNEMNWEIFPVPPGTKASYRSQRDNDRRWGASRDPTEVESFFKRRPKAGIGLPTGSDNGVFVVDADTHEGHGVDGINNLLELEEEHGYLPETLTAETPSGGVHYYFKYPPDVTVVSSSNELAPGVDVRGDGGMVLAPPSQREDGRRYRWVNWGTPIADAPAWLIDLICERRDEPAGGRESKKLNNHKPLEDDELRACVAAIRNREEIEGREWIKVAGAILSETGPTEFGFELFDEFSKRWEKPNGYDYQVTRKKWHQLCTKPLDHVTAGTLKWMANNDTPHWWWRWRTNGQATNGQGKDDVVEMRERLKLPTDLGNALRLVELHGVDLRFVPPWDKWLIWRDGGWRVDEDGHVMRLAKATAELMFAEALKIDDREERKQARRHAMSSQSSSRLASMVKLAETELPVILAANLVDADPMLLGVQNGVVDLRTGSFREATRADFVTKRSAATFDPSARCPQWESFVREMLPDEGVAEYAQRVFGYILTGLTGEEAMFIFWGGGANGKSTMRETLFELMGDYAVASDATLLITNKNAGGATPDVARLQGRRLVTINETSAGDVLNEARIKFITSHDVITARNLYENPFDFSPTHKTILTTQHKPIVKGTDEGIWRRLHLWAFLQVIPEDQRDRYFRERILAPELSGILNWALEGLRRYQADGLNPPPAVVEATKSYRTDMDHVGQWLEDRCIRDPKAQTPTEELYRDYATWSSIEIDYVMNKVAFGRNLGDRNEFKPIKMYVRGSHESDKLREVRGFKGIKLVNSSLPTGYTIPAR